MKDPKYKLLADELRERIKNGEWPPQTRLMTENQLAGQYRVGRQTVRLALDQLCRERLIYRRQGSGTFVMGKKPSARHSRLIGLITTFASYYIFPEILGSIEEDLRKYDCRILLTATQNSFCVERNILEDLLKQPIDGLIVECTCPQIPNPNTDLYRRFSQEKGIPVVFLNGQYEGLEDLVSVRVDDEGAGSALTSHLIQSGARSFGGLFRTDYHGFRRFKGLWRACYEHDVDLDEHLCMWFSDNESKEMLNSLLSPERITALSQLDAFICYNDAVALNVLAYLRTHGCRKIPLIASFDNTQLLKLSGEAITSITYPSRAVATCVVDKLMRMIGGKSEASVILPWDMDLAPVARAINQ